VTSGPTSQDDDLATREQKHAASTASESPASRATLVDPGRGLGVSAQQVGARYEVGSALGRGGMGEVRLAADLYIGREVARKAILPVHQGSADAQSRFLREARIQAQLEHPAIVPVYDVGIDANGEAYFTMKRLRGLSLSQIIKRCREGVPEALAAFPRRRLLSAFCAVCLAVDYAHARGVLHRDLKPSNIMLGDFGEVYVIDWGLAKIVGGQAGTDASQPGFASQASQPPRAAQDDSLGTPGYMSPEQASLASDALDPRSDVYALGAILFELLAFDRLHRGTHRERLASARAGVDARASARAPALDVPPELDAICVKATRVERGERHPSARALHDEVQRFLDGDRNLELRRDMAAEHVRAARGVTAAALSGQQGAEEARSRALAELGKALTLDPQCSEANALLERLFTEPPSQTPDEVLAEMDALAAGRHAFNLRAGMGADIVGVSCASLFAGWMGVREPSLVAVVWGFTLASVALKYVALRNVTRPAIGTLGYLAFLCSLLAVFGISRAFGPLFFTPLLVALFTAVYSTSHLRGYRAGILATGLLWVVVAVALEALGVLSPIYAFRDGAMLVLPTALTLDRWPTLLSLSAGTLFLMVVPSLVMGQIQDKLRAAEQRNLLQAWQLKQLAPRPKSDPPPLAPG
jgi:eukaryotic-like serine/threonine-protein kinase